MKVWIVEGSGQWVEDGQEVVGVYVSEERANKAVKAFQEEDSERWFEYYVYEEEVQG